MYPYLKYMCGASVSASLETGYFAQGALDNNDSIVGLLGLNTLNDEGELSYVPIRLSLRVRF